MLLICELSHHSRVVQNAGYCCDCSALLVNQLYFISYVLQSTDCEHI